MTTNWGSLEVKHPQMKTHFLKSEMNKAGHRQIRRVRFIPQAALLAIW